MKSLKTLGVRKATRSSKAGNTIMTLVKNYKSCYLNLLKVIKKKLRITSTGRKMKSSKNRAKGRIKMTTELQRRIKRRSFSAILARCDRNPLGQGIEFCPLLNLCVLASGLVTG
ncbi:Uncharacterized protein Adt_29222 [Abeliophyllum distichum]|uniref:Uncharacterized protein n=1 Tax=Abeliophyllum distichum TaxID=126358 RepID=A0ABD1R9H7_9LAMI